MVTNLPQGEFPAGMLKGLYAMRWGIETSFRALKYNVGMLCFHSLKKELVLQELFCKAGLLQYHRLYVVSTFAAAVQKEVSV